MTRDSSEHNLGRFIKAQGTDYARALAEMRRGRKSSHWMWYIFPQLRGLGRSSTAEFYGIENIEEARAYAAHPILGPRLIEIFEATLAVEGKSAHDIFGSPDDLKLRSCATLFAQVSAPGSPFERVLKKFYGGEPDSATLRLLGK